MPARPVETLAERVIASLDSRTLCAMVSTVLFETAEIVPGLDVLAAACRRHGVPLLLDAYHQLERRAFRSPSIGSGRCVRDGRWIQVLPAR